MIHPNPEEITLWHSDNIIKKVIKSYLVNNKDLFSAEQYEKLIHNLDNEILEEEHWSNIRSDRVFVNLITKPYYEQWNRQNHELSKFWKEVCVANASISDNPATVAHEATDALMKRFKIENQTVFY